MNMRQSRDLITGNVRTERTSGGGEIQWVSRFKNSQDGGLQIETGFSDKAGEIADKGKRSTIAQKLDTFKPENSFEQDKRNVRDETPKEVVLYDINKIEEKEDDFGKQPAANVETEDERSNDSFCANDRDDSDERDDDDDHEDDKEEDKKEEDEDEAAKTTKKRKTLHL